MLCREVPTRSLNVKDNCRLTSFGGESVIGEGARGNVTIPRFTKRDWAENLPRGTRFSRPPGPSRYGIHAHPFHGLRGSGVP